MIQRNADIQEPLVSFPSSREERDAKRDDWLRERLAQFGAETADPTIILSFLSEFPYRAVVPTMLQWYRSGDLWKVTMASVYLHHSGVMKAIDKLIGEIRCGTEDSSEAAKKELAIYGEFALKPVLRNLNGRDLQDVIRLIFAPMDERTINLVFRSLRNESASARQAVLEALSGLWGPHVRPILSDFLDIGIRFGGGIAEKVLPPLPEWERNSADPDVGY